MLRPYASTTLALALIAGCSDSDPIDDADAPRCGEAPRAYVLAPPDSAAATWLREAGFNAQPLPLDRSPRTLNGLIVIGSDASELPEYAGYMQSHADDLRGFVDAANVLLELPQRADREPRPPFLPTSHSARRSPAALEQVEVLAPDHPLLAGVEVDGGRLAWRGEVGRDAFGEQAGFQVLLAGAGDGSDAALLEGAHGQGRIVLSAIALDRPPGEDPAEDAFAGAFFANLADHVDGVCVGRSARVEPTPPPTSTPYTPGSTVFVALPGTGVYASRYPGVFESQTAWISRQAEALNIRRVLHLGDIVHDNSDREWARARDAMSLLDGVVPYAMVPGDRDYGPAGDGTTRQTGLHEFFGFEDALEIPGFAGAYDKGRLDNTYHLFEAGGRSWIVVALEWGPRDAVVDWADALMESHPDRLGVLVTHAYLGADDRRDDHRSATEWEESYRQVEVNDGEQLWQKLVRKHRFVLTLNGHVGGDGAGYLVSTTDHGNAVHQIAVNYQERELGGEGYLRLFELLPDGRTVVMRSYSPLLDRYLTGADQQRTFVLDVD